MVYWNFFYRSSLLSSWSRQAVYCMCFGCMSVCVCLRLCTRAPVCIVFVCKHQKNRHENQLIWIKNAENWKSLRFLLFICHGKWEWKDDRRSKGIVQCASNKSTKERWKDEDRKSACQSVCVYKCMDCGCECECLPHWFSWKYCVVSKWTASVTAANHLEIFDFNAMFA